MRDAEAESLVQFEFDNEIRFRAKKKGEAGDAIVEVGNKRFPAGTSVDAMGRLPDTAFEAWLRSDSSLNKNIVNFRESIDTHLEKIHNPKAGLDPLDYVLLDMKGFINFDQKIADDLLRYAVQKADRFKLSDQLIIINY